MSFWKGLKSAFGFGGDSDEDEDEYDSSLPTYAAQPRVAIPKPTSVPVVASPHSQATELSSTPSQTTSTTEKGEVSVANEKDSTTLSDPKLPGDLFDALIEQFNAIQPDFVAKCLSTDSQRAYIFNALSESLKHRIKHLSPTDDTSDGSESERLQRRITVLEAENKTAESLREENRKLHLSIERQKRALLDRINDLEAQVAKNRAERDKFFSDKRNPADAAIIDSTNARVKELETSMEERDRQISELQSSIAERDEQIAKLTLQRNQLEDKTKMSDEMINDLRNRAAAERHEYEDTCRQQQLDLEQIHEQVATFEQIKTRLEERITELKEALKEERKADKDAQISRLNEENASLRHTIENNLYNQANNETRLRNEIKQLRRELEQASVSSISASPAETYDVKFDSDQNSATQSQPDRPAPRRRGRPKKIKLDEDLDNTEWFSSHKDDPDFGYHEPPRRPANDNAAQLSLF